MSETSRSRVTITLGRTGQVVKRAGSTLDSSLVDEYPAVGSKRPVHERLGNYVDSSAEVHNKRQRRDGRTANAFYDSQLSKDDLRYKIMQKNIRKQSQNGQQSGGDLRNILSRPAQSSTNSVAPRERVPEPKDTRPRYLEPIDDRKHSTETRDERNLLPVTRNTSMHRVGTFVHSIDPEPKDTRPRYLEPIDDRKHFSETRDERNSLPVTRNTSTNIPEFRVGAFGHAIEPRKHDIYQAREGEQSIYEAKDVRRPMPEPRSSNAVSRMESGVSSFSPWTLDSLRRRSPDESLATFRGPSAPKKDEILQRRYGIGEYDDSRTSTYRSKDAFDVSRPMGSSTLTKMAPPVGQMKTVAPVASPFPLSGSLGQRSSYVVDDQVTVDSFLRTLGLEKFSILFKAEEVDMYSLKRMSERDLKELGIPMGPRKKILLGLQPRLKQQA